MNSFIAMRACFLVLLGILGFHAQLIGADSYQDFTNLIQIGDDPAKVISTVGPIFIYQPFGEESPAKAETVADRAFYIFKKKTGSLNASGGVRFIDGTVAFWGAGAVAKDLNHSLFERLLQPLVKRLGQPDSFDAATCTDFKGAINVPVATWRKGGVTYAVAWLLASDRPGWVEFKALKDGALEKDFQMFPVQAISNDERRSVIKQGMSQFQSFTSNENSRSGSK